MPLDPSTGAGFFHFGNLVEVAPLAGAPVDGLPSWPACWSKREAGELEFTTVDLPTGGGSPADTRPWRRA